MPPRRRQGTLLPVEKEKGDERTKIHTITMAEVAALMSNARSGNCRDKERVRRRRFRRCRTASPGSAQNMRRTVIRKDGVLTWGNADRFALCHYDVGYFLL